jgi:gamma-glutamyltranspeptidase / glutathione hydrolase / leukotriene-C4 hydrolase
MLNNPDWQPIFAPQNVLLKEGQILRRENLSRTLETIGKEGIGAFYNVSGNPFSKRSERDAKRAWQGSIGESIVRKAQQTGGILTMGDLANYSVLVRPALEGSFKGRKVFVGNAPTGGPVLLHMLNLAERLGLGDDASHLDIEEKGKRLHLRVECMKCRSPIFM